MNRLGVYELDILTAARRAEEVHRTASREDDPSDAACRAFVLDLMGLFARECPSLADRIRAACLPHLAPYLPEAACSRPQSR